MTDSLHKGRKLMGETKQHRDAWLDEVEVPPLTGQEIRALREAVDLHAQRVFQHGTWTWPLWKAAATADSKLFNALPKEAQDVLLEEAEKASHPAEEEG